MEQVVQTSHHQIDPQVSQQMSSSIAMWILLISWGILFATLFLVYAVLRGTNDYWPPLGQPKIPLLIPTCSTIIIFLSSFTYFLFEKDMMKNNIAKLKLWYSLTLLLGISFIMTQKLLWLKLEELGYFVESGVFTSLIYSFTWIHTAHVVLAMLGLLWPMSFVLNFKNELKNKWILRIQNIGKFWHFLGVIWVMMYLSLFVF